MFRHIRRLNGVCQITESMYVELECSLSNVHQFHLRVSENAYATDMK